ncbi:MAG: membrane protein FxsA [Gemmatimonadota bacterium]
MLFRLFLLFVGLPLVELGLLVEMGRWIGLLPTLALVFTTGAVGAALARHEGFHVWIDIQHELQQGRMPVANMLDGFMILIGGVLLLTPGLITDLLGLSLLLPVTRRFYKNRLRRRLERMMQSGQVTMFTLIR